MTRSYSRYALEAVALLGGSIRAARKERRMTAQELAERAGISRGLVQRIEKGELGCEIGSVFEAAAIVGVRLFDLDEAALRARRLQVEDRLTLLPRSSRKRTKPAFDDF